MGQVSVYGENDDQRVPFFRGGSAEPESVGRLGRGTAAIPVADPFFSFRRPSYPVSSASACHPAYVFSGVFAGNAARLQPMPMRQRL